MVDYARQRARPCRRQLHCGLLCDELLRTRDGESAKIVVPAAGNAHEALWRLYQAIKPLTESNWNDHVIFAMHYQYWRGDFASAQIRTKPVLHE
jgi:hypothetical protein